MKQVIDYIVIREEYTLGLERVVKDFLKKGYILQGGVSIGFRSSMGNDKVYVQAMIKESND